MEGGGRYKDWPRMLGNYILYTVATFFCLMFWRVYLLFLALWYRDMPHSYHAIIQLMRDIDPLFYLLTSAVLPIVIFIIRYFQKKSETS